MNTLITIQNVLTPLVETNSNATNTVNNVIRLVASICGGLIAVFLIYSIFKDALEFARGNGNGSIWKIIGKVAFLVLCIGMIFIAQDWENLANKGKNISNKGVNVIDKFANDVVQ